LAGLFDLLETDVAAFDAPRKAENIGLPVGGEAFLDRIAGQTGKAVEPRKRGQRQKEISTLSP
jgi:putative transposase